MFRPSICPSSGVQVVYYCIRCSALGVVAVVLRSRCVVLCTVCKFVSNSAVTYNQYSWRWAYRRLKHVEIFMIINHNFCIKLVPLVIFVYDARSHIRQNFNWSTFFNDSKTVSANNLLLNGTDSLLTDTTNSYYNTNFSTFMAICAALQSHPCKASYVMKRKDKSVALRLPENTQSITFHSNIYLWVTSTIIAHHKVRTTAAITRCTLYAGLWLN